MATAGPQESSDEEPDYMSEEFLAQCTKNDVRPSLIHNRVEKRKHEVVKRQQEVNKTKTEREQAMYKSLEDGLKVPISEDNKGFKMLQKMGFKPGSSIGKQSTGITAPIPIDLKKGRAGLGREQHELEQHQKTFGNPEEYRLRQQNAVLARETFLDLKKAVFACHNLDVEAGKTEPLEEWYWPKLNPAAQDASTTVEDDEKDEAPEPIKRRKVTEDEDSDDSSSHSCDEESITMSNEEKLDILKDYLRNEYFYCLWCATKYDNELDMNNYCPGLTKDAH